MIIVTGAVRARPETAAALEALCLAHAARSRTEPGCLAHAVHRDCADPLRFFFYEEWADADALAAHFKVPESRAFVRAARTLGETDGARIHAATPVPAPA
ncbi:MAG: putative quinol monooxygenase [Hyphomonadaceae bacterium]|nr:putative quinol monooxygenase [Hyphomonadaceae bacterium]